MATISMVPKLSWRSASKQGHQVVITYNRELTDSEFLNLHLRIRDYVPSDVRPSGYEAIDKSNPDDWEEYDG